MVQIKVKAVSLPPFAGAGDMPGPDIHVITSDGFLIPAHSKILAAASPVLETIIERPQKSRSTEQKVAMLGVPHDAVLAFIKFLYSSKLTDDEEERYAIHLLVLSHVYLVPQLKQRCCKGLAQRVTIDNAVDILQLARLCDSPDLHLKCMKLLTNNFGAVQKTEGWKFLQKHDPYLELEILQFIDEAESVCISQNNNRNVFKDLDVLIAYSRMRQRKKKIKRRRDEQSLYVELSEAMECLEHICSEGCTSVGPWDMDTNQHKGPCSKFSTCHGLQLLIIHFGACKKRVKGGCSRCHRMWQLFRLHSSICDNPEECRVPLCQHFKSRAQQERKGNDELWRLLVKRVAAAKAMSSLSLPHVKVDKES